MTFGVWKNKFSILCHMSKFKFETHVQIVITTITIHNFIKRKVEINIDFNLYKYENIVIHHNDCHKSSSDNNYLYIITFIHDQSTFKSIISKSILSTTKSNSFELI